MPRSPKVPNLTTINANTGQGQQTLPSRPNAKTPLCDHDTVRLTRNTCSYHPYHFGQMQRLLTHISRYSAGKAAAAAAAARPVLHTSPCSAAGAAGPAGRTGCGNRQARSSAGAARHRGGRSASCCGGA